MSYQLVKLSKLPQMNTITANRKTLLFTAACLLLSIRVIYFNSWDYLFLMWNIFLAWIPFRLSKWCIRSTQPLLKALLCFSAILFLPNAPYIITDLFHLNKSHSAPAWIDLIVISSFAILGSIYFIESIHLLLVYFNTMLKHKFMLRWIECLLLLLSAYGIYLGRFLRFNSWDVLQKPFSLLSAVLRSLFHNNHYKETWAITLAFTVFLFLIYHTFNLQRHVYTQKAPRI